MIGRQKIGWSRARWIACCLIATLVPALGTSAQEGEPERERERVRLNAEQAEQVLAGLEHGIVALERLGRHDARQRLERIAADVRRQLEGRRAEARERAERGGGERAIARRQIEALGLARGVLLEAERKDAAELVERAMHARELGLEGRRDPEAQAIRRSAPNREQTIELLVAAEALYREFGAMDRADMLSRLTEELWSRPGRERDRPRRDTRRGSAVERLEVMRTALPALLEAGRRDTAELLERAIRAVEVRLEGREDEEAIMIRERGPDLGQQVEILRYSAGLWREFGHEAKAERLDRLAEEMWNARPRREEGRAREERRTREEGRAREERRTREERRALDERREAGRDRVEALRRELDALRAAMEGLRAQLDALEREQREGGRLR